LFLKNDMSELEQNVVSEVANENNNVSGSNVTLKLDVHNETENDSEEVKPSEEVEVAETNELKNEEGNIKVEEDEDDEDNGSEEDEDEEEGEKDEEGEKEGSEVAEEKVENNESLLAVVEEMEAEQERFSEEGEQEKDQYDDEDSEDEVESDEDEPRFPSYDRNQLVREYNKAVAEREALTNRNNNAQHKIAEMMKRRKGEDVPQEAGGDAEQEQTYVKTLMNLETLMRQSDEERAENASIIGEYKEMVQEKEQQVEQDVLGANQFKKKAVVKATFLNGRVITTAAINQLESNEKCKSAAVSVVRLENIKLKNQVEKLTQKLRKKEELAEGLHLIDFEQLKIENQTYNEKIEERNEELLKLRKKITETVQVLTHIKEKLEFIEEENLDTKHTLKVVEKQLALKRDVINGTKRARDDLRLANRRLNLKMGLLGMDDLLEDYEVSYDEDAEIQQKIGDLKVRYAELTLNIRKVKQKIKLAERSK